MQQQHSASMKIIIYVNLQSVCMTHKMKTSLPLIALTISVLIVMCVVQPLVYAQASAALTAVPNDSNIFFISGHGFVPREPVILELYNGTTVMFSFTTVTADVFGSFNGTEIIPTSLYGNYSLVAIGTVGNETVTLAYEVPNLVGTTGATGIGLTGPIGSPGPSGIPGATGIKGAKGDTGNTGDTDSTATFAMVLGFASLIISIAAVVSVVRKRHVSSNFQ